MQEDLLLPRLYFFFRNNVARLQTIRWVVYFYFYFFSSFFLFFFSFRKERGRGGREAKGGREAEGERRAKGKKKKKEAQRRDKSIPPFITRVFNDLITQKRIGNSPFVGSESLSIEFWKPFSLSSYFFT